MSTLATSVDAANAARALAAKGPSYVPRTKHKQEDGSPRFTNRLIFANSPYLLQHAHNPVNWFPWGDEAFTLAEQLGRPVFLSIGYSTCHWCHVMEEESFEDLAIADYLNAHYIAVKVDREERPDIDGVYMSFVQALTGRGGWPMSVWLTPERQPFFGGTYFPPRSGARGARQGFAETLELEAAAFRADPERVAKEAGQMAARLAQFATPAAAGDLPGQPLLDKALASAARHFDSQAGGRNGAPKFPSSFPLRFLLRAGRRSADDVASVMAEKTLMGMRRGGIYDQIGGGFHRYSTDAAWVVPHFEKMLYDNALLVVAYLEAFQHNKNPAHAETARQTLDYLLREMTAPDGTFYSATDADSVTPSGHRDEGYFFTWTPAELSAALAGGDAKAAGDAELATRFFGVSARGNFEGRSIPVQAAVPEASEQADVDRLAKRLLLVRSKRPLPLLDHKALASWNGLTISAFARAALVLAEPRYAAAAEKAARAWLANRGPGGRLEHQRIDTVASGEAFADDYSHLAAAMLDVFELTSDVAFLDAALQWMNLLETEFLDAERGGYFLTSTQHEALLVRDKPDGDGPVPSANAVAARNWQRLAAWTTEDLYRQRAERTVKAFAVPLDSRPLSMNEMLCAVDWFADVPREIVIVVPEGKGVLAAASDPMVKLARSSFEPNSVVLVASEAELVQLSKRVPWAEAKVLRNGETTAYLCESTRCKLPTSEVAEFAKQLRAVGSRTPNAP